MHLDVDPAVRTRRGLASAIASNSSVFSGRHLRDPPLLFQRREGVGCLSQVLRAMWVAPNSEPITIPNWISCSFHSSAARSRQTCPASASFPAGERVSSSRSIPR